MPSRPASAADVQGPGPPKAIRAKRRGSIPRSIVITRSAPSISDSATSRMPSAQRTSSSRGTAASVPTRAGRPSRSSARRPPAATSASRRPSSEVGVGDGRLRPATAVAGGPGLGPGRLGPDAQRAAAVAPGDRTAAGADRVDVEHPTPAAGRHAPLRRSRRPGAPFDQADIPTRFPPCRSRARPGSPAARRAAAPPRRPRPAPRARSGRRGALRPPSIRPPEDCIIWDLGQPGGCGVRPDEAAPDSRAEQRREGRVDLGRGRALVLAKGAHELVGRARRWDPRQTARRAARRACARAPGGRRSARARPPPPSGVLGARCSGS